MPLPDFDQLYRQADARPVRRVGSAVRGVRPEWRFLSKASPIPSVQVCLQWIKGNPPLPKSRPSR